MHRQQAQQAQQAQQHRNPNPYAGQWTKEEQEYVACLREGFKSGTLDIPDGTSLRFFIAAKLGCKPKRVSKKYERSGYNGKQVYRRDTNVSASDLEAYRQRLKDSEKAFKDSRALVVSMQEAKTDCKPSSSSQAVTETPIISLHSNTNTSNALEDRLQAMRSQIDRRTTTLLGYPAPTRNTTTGGRYMSPEVLQAMMLQRQRAAGLQGAAGFSTGFPSAGLTGATGASSGPANKLLIDLYQRRQQLIMSYMAAGAGTGTGTGAGAGPATSTMGAPSTMSSMMMGRTSPMPSMMASPHDFASLGPLTGDKRDSEDFQGAEEQARKRARAA